jgi:glycosyltransferase involved in cell wall biosynthesis
MNLNLQDAPQDRAGQLQAPQADAGPIGPIGPTGPRGSLGLLVNTWPKLSETFILEEVLGLERQGVNLRLYALGEPTDEITHGALSRVRSPLVRVPAALPRSALIDRHARMALAAPMRYGQALLDAGVRGAAGRQDFLRAGWLAAQLKLDGVAHLHTHFISQPADIAQAASRMSGIPFSISAHAKDIYLSDAADLRRKLRAAQFTVTCTEANRSALAAIAPQADVHLMYHGIDHGIFHPSRRVAAAPGEPPLILAVGRLRAKKGLDTLIDACRLLHERGQRVRCDIVGYGQEHDALAHRIENAGLGRHVRLAGKLAREQVIERYARAAVFVQPSRIGADGDRDGIPNVLLEAMAMGLPVVASRVSGIPEVVRDGVNGLLVEADAPLALAEAIERALLYPAHSAAMGLAARRTVAEGFDNDVNLRVLLRLLEPSHVCGAQCAVAA